MIPNAGVEVAPGFIVFPGDSLNGNIIEFGDDEGGPTFNAFGMFDDDGWHAGLSRTQAEHLRELLNEALDR